MASKDGRPSKDAVGDKGFAELAGITTAKRSFEASHITIKGKKISTIKTLGVAGGLLVQHEGSVHSGLWASADHHTLIHMGALTGFGVAGYAVGKKRYDKATQLAKERGIE